MDNKDFLNDRLETEREDSFTVGSHTYQMSHSSLYRRVLDSWVDMRKATRRLIDEDPSESRLLFYILMSDLIFFLSWSLKAVVSPTENASEFLPTDVGLWLVLALFARTAVVYLFSVLLGIAMRLAGGQGSWKATRAAVFWGAFVAAPFGLLFALITVAFSALEGVMPFLANDLISQAPYWLSLIPFVWFISAGLAEAHKFRLVAPIFGTMTVLTMVLWVLFLYLSAIGIFTLS
ncbi:MAG: YIP1 family protein [Rhodobacteraceae bacterium]|nr:YIP1 family protein [Paracoccaceae bacterium]